MQKYPNLHDAQMRTRRSWFQGPVPEQIVYIGDMTEDATDKTPLFHRNVYERKGRGLISVDTDIINVNDDRALSIDALKIGFVNFENKGQKGCCFASRAPRRCYKQGLSDENSSLYYISSEGPNPISYRFSFHSPEYFGSIVNSYFEVYPSLNEAKEQLIMHKYPVAVSKDFALAFWSPRHICVVYQTTILGWLNPRDFSVVNRRHEAPFLWKRLAQQTGLHT